MDTTKKGDKLEEKVYSMFAEEISENRFFAKKECCQLYKKKGYYSKDRGKDIIFDVSIEITFPRQTAFSILILIECKNYNHKVPVDDVEEFFSKSKGIGLLRYYDRNNLDWVLTRSPSGLTSSNIARIEFSNAFDGLHSQNHKSRYLDCYAFIDEIYTNSLHQFLSCLVKINLEESLGKSLAKIEQESQGNSRVVPYQENFEIEKISKEVLQGIEYEDGVVSLDKICESLIIEHDLKYIHNTSLDVGVLGMISFDPFVIRIDSIQSENEQRKRFTLAHELGHFFLGHQRYMKGENCHISDVDLENPRGIGIKDVVRMEWQANYFASCLLLPKDQFVKAFLIEAIKNELLDRGYGLLYLDDQSCNMDAFYKVTAPLIYGFNVSRSVAKIRLKNLGYLNEKTNQITNLGHLSKRKSDEWYRFD